MLKKIFVIFLFSCVMSPMTIISSSQNTYENDSRYIKAKNALDMKDYAVAEKLLLELSAEKEFGAKALRSLAQIKMEQRDYDSAYTYANKAYQEGDIKSGPILVSILIKKNELDSDQIRQLIQQLEYLVYKDPLMADNAIILIRRLGKLETESGIARCLDMVRQMPLEVLVNSAESIKILIQYSDRLKIEDKILLSYLLKNMSPVLRESELKNISYQPMPLPPRPSYADAFKFSKEFDDNTNPLINNSGTIPLKDLSLSQLKAIDWAALRIKYEILMQHPEYQLLGLIGLSDMAFYQEDFGRLEQLSELALRCGADPAVTNLIIALIHNDKLAEVKQYESYLFEQAKWPNTSGRLTQVLLVRYSLITDNKKLFLDWARIYPWNDMLSMEGLRKLVIEGLEKWGESGDQSLLDYLCKTPARSPEDYDWNGTSSKTNQ